MVIIVIIDNGFLVGITRGCRQRVCHTTLNFVVSGATYPILFYFCMFSKENWYQSYWFEFFRLNCVHLYMQSNSIEYLFAFFFLKKMVEVPRGGTHKA